MPKVLTFNFKRNGLNMGKVTENKLSKENILKVFSEQAKKHFEEARKEGVEVVSDIVSGINRRGLRREYKGQAQTHLSTAYKEAAGASTVYIDGKTSRVAMRLIDTQILDERLPVDGQSKRGTGGWWRFHEFGSSGQRIGSSTRFGFAKGEAIKAVLGTKKFRKSFPGGKVGRHTGPDAGIMVRVDSPLGKALNLQPHPGFIPFRIARQMQNTVRRRMNNLKGLLPLSIAQRLVR